MSAAQPEITTEMGFPAPDDDFLTYPIHKVVSVFDDPNEVAAAVKELQSVGFTSDDIQAFCGWEAKGQREFEGTHRGLWESFVHAARHVGPAASGSRSFMPPVTSDRPAPMSNATKNTCATATAWSWSLLPKNARRSGPQVSCTRTPANA